MTKRVFAVAILSLTSTLLSCRMTNDLAVSPEIPRRVHSTADCKGKHHTLLPNEYLGEDWYANAGTQVEAINEVAQSSGQTDGYYISENPGYPIYAWARFGFTNIANPHPSSGVLDLTLRFFAHTTPANGGIPSLDVEVYVDGVLVRSATVSGVGNGERKMLTASFADMGALAGMNSLEVRFRAHDYPTYVHSLNAEIFSFVPTPDCPEPTQY